MRLLVFRIPPTPTSNGSDAHREGTEGASKTQRRSVLLPTPSLFLSLSPSRSNRGRRGRFAPAESRRAASSHPAGLRPAPLSPARPLFAFPCTTARAHASTPVSQTKPIQRCGRCAARGATRRLGPSRCVRPSGRPAIRHGFAAALRCRPCARWLEDAAARAARCRPRCRRAARSSVATHCARPCRRADLGPDAPPERERAGHGAGAGRAPLGRGAFARAFGQLVRDARRPFCGIFEASISMHAACDLDAEIRRQAAALCCRGWGSGESGGRGERGGKGRRMAPARRGHRRRNEAATDVLDG